MLLQESVIGLGPGIAIILLIVVIFLLIVHSKKSKPSSDYDLKSERWLKEESPLTTSHKTELIEAVHIALMFLLTIPFYLYGGNILYGYILFLLPDELVALVVRAALSVLIVEFFFNWIPYLVFHFKRWRTKGLYILFSGISFASLTYFVLSPQYFEGEAFIGMGFIWIICGIIIHLLFNRIGWYNKKSK